jgi:hypothetical protein
MKPTDYHHTYIATHTGWLLFCPLWLADIDSIPVPIPRGVPHWWYDFNFWLNDQLQWLVSLVNENAVGYMFYHVRELGQPREVKVRAEHACDFADNPPKNSTGYVCEKCHGPITICDECKEILIPCECGHCHRGATFAESE